MKLLFPFVCLFSLFISGSALTESSSRALELNAKKFDRVVLKSKKPVLLILYAYFCERYIEINNFSYFLVMLHGVTIVQHSSLRGKDLRFCLEGKSRLLG